MERKPLCGCSMASFAVLQLQALFPSLVPIHFLFIYAFVFHYITSVSVFILLFCTQTETTAHYYPIKTDIYVSALNPKVPTSVRISCRVGQSQQQIALQGRDGWELLGMWYVRSLTCWLSGRTPECHITYHLFMLHVWTFAYFILNSLCACPLNSSEDSDRDPKRFNYTHTWVPMLRHMQPAATNVIVLFLYIFSLSFAGWQRWPRWSRSYHNH